MADARPHSPSSAVSWAAREIVEAFLDEVCARHLARSRCGGASRLTLEMQATAIPRPARPVRCSASRSKQRALSRCSGPQAQSIEGMPSLMGNFLPVSGQTSCPSTISTSSSTWCSARRNGSSSRNSAGTSAGSGGSRASCGTTHVTRRKNCVLRVREEIEMLESMQDRACTKE
eukprot:6181471-Pleurochrysis_carterae.AAC.7